MNRRLLVAGIAVATALAIIVFDPLFTGLTWAILTAALGVFEIVALRDRVPRNTWSYRVWEHIMPYLGTRLVAIPAWMWLTWHWWLEAQIVGQNDPVDMDDLIAVVFGVLVALWATTVRTNRNIR